MRLICGWAGLAAVLVASSVLRAAPKAATAPGGVQDEVSREGTVLTTTFRLEMRGVAEAQADAAEKAALAEIERLRNVLDTYDANSEIRRMQLSVNKPFVCSADLYAVLRACAPFRYPFDTRWLREVTDGGKQT